MFNYLVTREKIGGGWQFNVYNTNTNQITDVIKIWHDNAGFMDVSVNCHDGLDYFNNYGLRYENIVGICNVYLRQNQKVVAVYIARTIGIDC